VLKVLLAVTSYPSASPDRRRLFAEFGAPSIRGAADVAGQTTIRVYGGAEHVCVKRQRALDEALREGFRWVFCCDDDIVLASTAIARLRRVASGPATAIVYCDYVGICLPGGEHPKGPVFVQRSVPWSRATLRRRNLVSTMSLFDVRQLARAGVRWDPGLARFQDWDLALQSAEAGLAGVHVPESLFHAFYSAPGITARVPYARAIAALRAKHPEVKG